MCYIEKLQQLFKKEKNNQGMLLLTITEMIIEYVCFYSHSEKSVWCLCVCIHMCTGMGVHSHPHITAHSS